MPTPSGTVPYGQTSPVMPSAEQSYFLPTDPNAMATGLTPEMLPVDQQPAAARRNGRRANGRRDAQQLRLRQRRRSRESGAEQRDGCMPSMNRMQARRELQRAALRHPQGEQDGRPAVHAVGGMVTADGHTSLHSL